MPKRAGRPWQRVKRRVISRDRGICHICGQAGADSADHIVPAAHGGALYDMANLRAVHHNAQPQCNRVRGDRSIDQARNDLAPLLNQPDDWTW